MLQKKNYLWLCALIQALCIITEELKVMIYYNSEVSDYRIHFITRNWYLNCVWLICYQITKGQRCFSLQEGAWVLPAIRVMGKRAGTNQGSPTLSRPGAAGFFAFPVNAASCVMKPSIKLRGRLKATTKFSLELTNVLVITHLERFTYLLEAGKIKISVGLGKPKKWNHLSLSAVLLSPRKQSDYLPTHPRRCSLIYH